MRVIDYNGTGAWSRDGIIARYAGHARRFKVSTPASWGWPTFSPRISRL
jgi:hypothetical protein